MAFRLEVIGQACATLLVPFIIFGPRWAPLELFYLSFIPIIWIAMRQGIKRAATGLIALNFGVVIAMNSFPPPPASAHQNYLLHAGGFRHRADPWIGGDRTPAGQRCNSRNGPVI